ncbi:MAG TPA: hypothetical protein VEP90_08360 [Methylomirabilota bacterium]|nr:hypothetical protein [Methylomirabilota bacterium]
MNLGNWGIWLNDNQGILALIIFLAGLLISFLIWVSSKKYFLKKRTRRSKDNREEKHVDFNAGKDIHAGRDIIGIQHITSDSRQMNSIPDIIEMQEPLASLSTGINSKRIKCPKCSLSKRFPIFNSSSLTTIGSKYYTCTNCGFEFE